ncbi:hypothetical protein [Salinispora arenicola]|uniref:hypothetical protein n=1 Tax=Salinispora arenicola TaxID=168697 RepID=UPI0003622555|nr:hypothetical protein [Salinispora arenicola]
MVAGIKAGSKAYRDRVRAQLVGLGFAGERLTEQLAADLVARCGKRPREAWRLANELPLDEVAVRGNALIQDPRAPRGSEPLSLERRRLSGCRRAQNGCMSIKIKALWWRSTVRRSIGAVEAMRG